MLARPAIFGVAAAILAGPAAAQSPEAKARPEVGQGDAYRAAPPFPSQRDGKVWMRQITVLDPSTGERAVLNVLSNSPVPNPGAVPSATAQGRDAAAGSGTEYADAPPFPSQRDGVFLVRQLTLVDPLTGRSQTVRILSNTPVPDPDSVKSGG